MAAVFPLTAHLEPLRSLHCLRRDCRHHIRPLCAIRPGTDRNFSQDGGSDFWHPNGPERDGRHRRRVARRSLRTQERAGDGLRCARHRLSGIDWRPVIGRRDICGRKRSWLRRCQHGGRPFGPIPCRQVHHSFLRVAGSGEPMVLRHSRGLFLDCQRSDHNVADR